MSHQQSYTESSSPDQPLPQPVLLVALVLGPFSFTAFPISLCLSALLPSLHTSVSKTACRPYELSKDHCPFLNLLEEVIPGKKLLLVNDRNPTPTGPSEEETLNAHSSLRKGWIQGPKEWHQSSVSSFLVSLSLCCCLCSRLILPHSLVGKECTDGYSTSPGVVSHWIVLNYMSLWSLEWTALIG